MYEAIYIISDIHLSADRLNILKLFDSFLQKLTNKKKHIKLFILGDLFDFWIGDDYLDDFNLKVIEVLKKASLKIDIFIIKGNRDFLLAKKFENLACVKILKDFEFLKFKNQKIMLAHGDLFCTLDKKYLRFRKIVNNFIIKRIFLFLPKSFRLKIAKKIRSTSIVRKQSAIYDVTTYGINKYKKDADIVIHGHTHKMGVYDNFTRYVLGDWFLQGSYIKISDKILLESFNFDYDIK